jgi:acyl carrier protein
MVQSFEAPPAADADGRPASSRAGDRDAAETDPRTGTPSKVLPRTPVERGIAEIWSAALDRDGIGVHDDFFELDGDSLTAIKVITRIREAWGVGIPPAVFFENPTVAALALAVVQGAPAQRRSSGADHRTPSRCSPSTSSGCGWSTTCGPRPRTTFTRY